MEREVYSFITKHSWQLRTYTSYAHEFIICFVSEEGKKLTVIVTAMNQTRRKSMTRVYRPVNSEEKVISIPKTFMIPLFIEHGSNYLETEKRNL